MLICRSAYPQWPLEAAVTDHLPRYAVSLVRAFWASVHHDDEDGSSG